MHMFLKCNRIFISEVLFLLLYHKLLRQYNDQSKLNTQLFNMLSASTLCSLLVKGVSNQEAESAFCFMVWNRRSIWTYLTEMHNLNIYTAQNENSECLNALRCSFKTLTMKSEFWSFLKTQPVVSFMKRHWPVPYAHTNYTDRFIWSAS